ncbi:hypothetical protein LPJ56_005905, partial [Coemansia sp. RSA 2599]
MEGNIDRALDDIIGEKRRDGGRHSNRHGGGRSGHRRHHNHHNHHSSGNSSGRNSPYARNQASHSQGHSQGQGRWRHDLFDGPKSINDRLGPQAKGIESRLGDNTKGGKRSRAKQSDSSSSRGLAIAGRTRDTKTYDEMRVVFAKGLPRNYTQEQIERMFGDVGRIDHVRMGIDKNNRFIGKAEITYRLAEDARSAIQLFDGEMLYGTESALLSKIEIGYSSPEAARMLESVRFEDSLPTPRALPIQSRLGGVGAGALASAAMLAAAQQQQQEQMMAMMAANRSSDDGGNQNRRGQQRHNAGRNRHRKPEVTAQELDDDLDSYMKESDIAPAAADESAM